MGYLGFIALVMVLATMARWFYRAWQVNVPSTPYRFQALTITGLVLGAVAINMDALDTSVLNSGASATAAGWAIGLALLFLYLSSTGAQKVANTGISVGDTLPTFTAPDDNGDTFDSASLDGCRVLLKFFRGHW